MARNLKERRSLHQIWCDTRDKVTEDQYVYWDNKYWRFGYLIPIQEPCLFGIANKEDFVATDMDWIYEKCYEVFPHEAKALDILYKPRK